MAQPGCSVAGANPEACDALECDVIEGERAWTAGLAERQIGRKR